MRARDLLWRYVVAEVLGELAGSQCGPWFHLSDPVADGLGDLTDFLLLMGLLWIWGRRHQAGWRQGFGGPPEDRKLWWLGLLVIPLIGFSISCNTVLTHFFPTFMHSDDAEWENRKGALWLILCLLAGPFQEEVIFRGILFRRWRLKWGLWPGLLASSVLFGVLHASTFLDATVFGCVLCLVSLKTGNLFIPFVIHALNNLAVSLLDLLPDSAGGAASSGNQDVLTPTETWVAAGGLLLSIAILVVMLRRMKLLELPKPAGSDSP